MKECSAKITIPMRSFLRFSINSFATNFAASNLFFGFRSIAIILPETSKEIIISIPSPFTLCFWFANLGLAKATMMEAINKERKINGRKRKKELCPAACFSNDT